MLSLLDDLECKNNPWKKKVGHKMNLKCHAAKLLLWSRMLDYNQLQNCWEICCWHAYFRTSSYIIIFLFFRRNQTEVIIYYETKRHNNNSRSWIINYTAVNIHNGLPLQLPFTKAFIGQQESRVTTANVLSLKINVTTKDKFPSFIYGHDPWTMN